MKKIFLLVLIGLFVPISLVYGEIYVVYNKDTNEIVFITEKQNFEINDPDLKVKTLPNDLGFYNLENPFDEYLLQGNKIILNTEKITAKEDKIKEEKAKEEQKIVDQEKAKQKLMSPTWTPLTEEEFNSLVN